MKTLFKFLMLLNLALIASACEKEQIKEPESPENPYEYFAGTWYDESVNEEVTYTINGYYYDRYTTIQNANETEGRIELSEDGNKMVTTYTYIGETLYTNWDVKDKTELSFTLYNKIVGSQIVQKVVEKYKLEVGESMMVSFPVDYPNYSVTSFSSKNEFIATVDSKGVITATGEKGTTYVKIETASGDVAWVKVVVGDDCFDMWYDFPSFIGKDMSAVTTVMGQPTLSGSDGYSFGYTLNYHSYIKEVDVFLNLTTAKVEEIALVFHDSVIEAEILSYMKSKYYPSDLLGDSVHDFTTGETIETSRAFVSYDTDLSGVVWFEDPSIFELIPDFTHTFGMTLSELQEIYPMASDSQIYIYGGNDFAEGVFFSIDESTGLVNAYAHILRSDANLDTLSGYLLSKYYLYKQTETTLAFVDSDIQENVTLGIVLDIENLLLIYYDMRAMTATTKVEEWCDTNVIQNIFMQSR